jgi:hypothetical protein
MGSTSKTRLISADAVTGEDWSDGINRDPQESMHAVAVEPLSSSLSATGAPSRSRDAGVSVRAS